MKRRILILTMLPPLIFIIRCSGTANKRKEQQNTIYSYEVIQKDTLNRIDGGGFKQGRWIVFQMPSLIPVEEGMYVNNEKDGVWKYYDSAGKVMRLVKFKNGRAR